MNRPQIKFEKENYADVKVACSVIPDFPKWVGKAKGLVLIPQVGFVIYGGNKF